MPQRTGGFVVSEWSSTVPNLRLGNPAALDQGRPLPGDRVTTAHLPDDWTLSEQIRSVVHDEGGPLTGFWVAHSSAPGPSWVASDSPELEKALAEHYGCPIGEPAAAPAPAPTVAPAPAAQPPAAPTTPPAPPAEQPAGTTTTA